jgi:Uma2 family endonuclease
MSAIATPLPPLINSPPVSEPAPPFERLYRISVEKYHQLAEHGILGPKDRVVLIRGLLVKQMTKGIPHVTATGLTRTALEKIIPGNNWFLNVQDPIALADSEPEPDISAIRGNRRAMRRIPTANDVGMLVEISDSSLQYDQTTQLELFAEARIPVYWIVNLIDRQIEVYTEPSGPAAPPSNGKKQVFGLEDSVPVVLDGVEVGKVLVRDCLP